MTNFFKRFRLTHIIAGLCAGFILISTVAVTTSYMGYKEANSISEIWLEFEKSGPSQKNALYHDLHATLGFGGMIHQFKNYVIRNDAPRLQKIRDKAQFAANVVEQYLALPIDSEERSALEAIASNIRDYQIATDTAESLVASGKSISEIDSVIKVSDGAAVAGLVVLGEKLGLIIETSGQSISESVLTLKEELAVGSLIILIFAALLSTATLLALRGLYQQLGTEPSHLRQAAEAIAQGNLDYIAESDESRADGVLKAMITMRENLRSRIEADQIVAQENGRIKQALENSSVSLMITDSEGMIIYINTALRSLLSSVGGDIKNVNPGLNSANLVGNSLELFHQYSDNLSSVISNLKATHTAEIPIGQLHIRIVANPIWGESNSRLGTVIEWVDRTQQIATEEEIQHIVNNAKSGELGHRINLDGKVGFFARLSTGVNEMVNASDMVIKDTAKAINAMSNGDLTHSIEGNYEGDFGSLKDDVNATIVKLTEVVGGITYNSQAVFAGSQEIANGNANLSSRTEQQSSNLEETALNMEEMTSTVRQNAENALEASRLARGTRKQAEQGGHVLNKAVSAMTEITDSSNKIVAIIGVIDEIAFQTNLLALNAAVEAARAGEQGRGFAVVASEVRNLAGRSATAANEIKGLIKDSVTKVEEGSKLVDESGRTLEEIVGSVKQVSDIISDIANASQEQSDGIDQVNRAIAQIDEVTQQNTTLVEEAASASTSMGEKASNLNEMVGFFKTKALSNAVAPGFQRADEYSELKPAHRASAEKRSEVNASSNTPLTLVPTTAVSLNPQHQRRSG